MYTINLNYENNSSLAVQDFKSLEINQDLKNWYFDVDDIKLFEKAVKKAYRDAQRRFVGIKNTRQERTAFNNLAESIRSYFEFGTDDFDLAHSVWCHAFINDIKKYNGGIQITYGKAQKVINMTFKYLYCCNGIDKHYIERFRPCHMPLDGFTVAWLFIESNMMFYNKWSYYNKETYDCIQTRIRSLLNEDILKKEFVIWNEFNKLGVKPEDIVEKLYTNKICINIRH